MELTSVCDRVRALLGWDVSTPPVAVAAGALIDPFTQKLAAPRLNLPINITANGAIDPSASGIQYITKAGVAVMTLAAPIAGKDDGRRIVIISTTANAHTITQTTPGFNNLGTAADVATFTAAINAAITLEAYNGVWWIVSLNAVTAA